MRLEQASTQTVAEVDRPAPRDYSLTGPEGAVAIAAGLADAQWYRPPIDADRLRSLMERTNWRAACDTTLWFVLLVGIGTAAFISLGTWYAIPAFAVFGALYGGSADARWHENGHGTAFRAKWANDVVYYMASFMLLREPTLWRWSHFRHHSDTIIVGRDAEIGFPRPTPRWKVLVAYLNLIKGPQMVWVTLQHAVGRIDGTTRELVPKEDFRRVIWEARAFVAVWLGVIAWAVASGSIVPLLFVGLPSFYGAWLVVFFGITQHAGLKEDVLDHRLNTRTVYINPVFRFLYLNMNYHVEHHIFPTVPYYNLPALHREIRAYLPPPRTSMFAAYRELLHALRKQRQDPTWELPVPDFPDGPYVPEAGPAAVPSDGGRPVEAPAADRPDLAAMDRTDLGPVSSLAVGDVRRIDHAGNTYALYRLGNDEFALTDGLCTHAQTHLADGHLEGGVIECPKHNGRFDVRTGEAIRRPPKLALCTYAVEVADGRVIGYLGPGRLAAAIVDAGSSGQDAPGTVAEFHRD
ncbi:MAG TPA: fatty acid desaturase [Acidimicrobiales bacterium]|nr:fatty acid desaturase [Acidimicrobiales bacterium]